MNLAKWAVLFFSGWFALMGTGYAQQAGGSSAEGAQAYVKVLHDADELMKAGKPADAYALLEPLEFEHAGEERFDYLLGVAALDSGKPDKATLAFERVLMVNPNSAGARLELARAYYQLGDTLRARTEFETVLKQNPSPAARATIQKYLDAIAAQEPGRTHLAGYIEGTLGRDSNVNNATAQSQVSVNIPGVGMSLVALNPTSMKMADNYYGLAAGGEAVHGLNQNWGVYAGADLRQRTYASQKNFDSLGAEARAGAIYGAEANRMRFGVLGGTYTLGPTRNRNSAGFNADWGHAFSPGNQVNLFGQYLQYRFADIAMQVNDFNQQVVGAGWVHVLADGKSMLSGSVYGGREQDTSSIITTATPSGGRTDGAKRFGGLRIGGQTNWGEQTLLFANAGWQSGSYSRTNPFFLVQRSDKFQDLTLGANWHWDALWSVRPQLSYARNQSNIAIYSYNRADVSVTLRRDFK
ncbi:MAG TPA: tetratricopeptide repeat protein [Gallionellaceae bacterium]